MDADFWNQGFKENPDSVIIEDCILDTEIADLQPSTALDLGCGSGVNALKLAALGWDVLGVDWSEHAVKLANEAAVQRHLSAKFIVGDLTKWEAPSKFALVISTYALPAGEDAKQALHVASDALDVGGLLLIAEWDASMTEEWGFSEGELRSPDEIAAMVSELTIEKAEVLRLERIKLGEDTVTANVALVRATK